jgi:uncharacterized protein DUF4386
MTASTNSRVAGITFLAYIVIGLSSMYVDSLIVRGAEDSATRLSNIAQSTSLMQLQIILTLLSAACAIVIAVTVYGLTRDIDRELAIFAFVFRLAEGIIIIMATLVLIASMSVAANATGSSGDNAHFLAMGTVLQKIESVIGMGLAALCFSVGSTFYCYLFLKGRSIPTALAWLGFLGSLMLVILVPLQLAGYLKEGPITTYMWMPMLVFELIFSFWLIFKGVKRVGTQF